MACTLKISNIISNFAALCQNTRGDTLEVMRVVQAATHSEPGTLRFPMIPGNGVYRVRRRRFADVRSGSTSGGSTTGGSRNGGSGRAPSSIRLVSIAALSVSVSMLSI